MSANGLTTNFKVALFDRDTHNVHQDLGIKRTGAGTNLTTVFSDMFKREDLIRFDRGVAATQFPDMADHVINGLNVRNDNPASEDVIHFYKDTYRVLSALQDTAKIVGAEITDQTARKMLVAMDGITLKAIDQAESFIEGIERRTLREYLMQDLVDVEQSNDWAKTATAYKKVENEMFGTINIKFQSAVDAIVGENREKLGAGEQQITGHSNFSDYRI